METSVKRALEIRKELDKIETELTDSKTPESFKAILKDSKEMYLSELNSYSSIMTTTMGHKHRIDPKSLLSVLTAEKNNDGADFTVISKETGKEYTFKISRSRYKDAFYTFVKVEKEYQNYETIGSYFQGNIWKSKKPQTTPASLAIAWILAKVEAGKFDLLNEKIELYHLGFCLRCGAVLTDSKSIERGLGPVCVKF